MSFRVTAWVLEHSEARLAARLVHLVLAEYAHDDGSNAFPSVETIARKARISPRAVHDSLRKLREEGWIEPMGTRDSGTVVYRVVLTQPKVRRGYADSAPPAKSAPLQTLHPIHHLGGSSRDGEVDPSESPRDTTADPSAATVDVAEGQAALLPGEVDQVWAHYAKTMKPRRTEATEEDRKLIRAALKVATAAECCRAIEGCRASKFHMGENDRGRKYNKLSQIVKGRVGKETTRERIDFFLDLADDAARGGKVTSGDPAVISDRKRLVQRGWRFSDNPGAVREAEMAEEWLKEHGVEVVRGEDDYPTFQALRSEAA